MLQDLLECSAVSDGILADWRLRRYSTGSLELSPERQVLLGGLGIRRFHDRHVRLCE